MMQTLSLRVQVLRDEVLETVERGDREHAGVEFFDAVIRALEPDADQAMLDLTLHDAIARRLAWGDQEEDLLADAERVRERLLSATERALRNPDERIDVIAAATRTTLTLTRLVAMHAMARAQRDRAGRLREELAQRYLKETLDKQHTAILRLEQALEELSYS